MYLFVCLYRNSSYGQGKRVCKEHTPSELTLVGCGSRLHGLQLSVLDTNYEQHTHTGDVWRIVRASVFPCSAAACELGTMRANAMGGSRKTPG